MLKHVKSYKRRLPSGKIITVKGYSYDDGKSNIKRDRSYSSRKNSRGAELLNAADKRKQQIKELYKAARIKAPSGKGRETHTVAFHKKALEVMKGMRKAHKPVDRNMAYAIAMKQLGRDKAVLKKHWQ